MIWLLWVAFQLPAVVDAYPSHGRFAALLNVRSLEPDCRTVLGEYVAQATNDGLPIGSYRRDGACVEGEREVPGGRLRFSTKACTCEVVRCDHRKHK